jgi:hypothetical protein
MGKVSLRFIHSSFTRLNSSCSFPRVWNSSFSSCACRLSYSSDATQMFSELLVESRLNLPQNVSSCFLLIS